MPKVDEIGSWSTEKLKFLGEYLAAFSSILKTQRSWCKHINYIDAFAGTVKPYDKSHKEYIDGSPRVALQVNPPFDRYDFIEIKKGRVSENLAPLQEEFSDKQIQVHHGDCNSIIQDEILPLYKGGKSGCKKRGFIFLDPYGLELNWETVEAIGESEVFDVFINFSVMGVTRQCSTKPPTGKKRERINRLMGATDWIDEVYVDNQECALPGMEDSVLEKTRLSNVTDKLAKYYVERLKSCFNHVSDYKIMRADNNAPLYALILASQVPVARMKMHEIFRRHEKQTGRY